MTITAVVGTKWGDEGKGRVIDVLSADAEAVIRFQGGDNAGHTVVDDLGEVFKLHTLPCGIIREGKECIVGPGVVVWLPVANDELAISRRMGSRVMIDESAPIILPIHRALDAAREKAARANAIGTTKRGIGPVYSDFWLRRGPVMGDLRSRAKVEEILSASGYFDELVATMRYLSMHGLIQFKELGFDIDPRSFEQTVDWVMKYGEVFVPHLGDTRQLVWWWIDKKGNLLFEGAQAMLLDGYFGDRRNRTSSLCGISGIFATFGDVVLDDVIGVVKAYDTRVGNGPFPTELNGKVGAKLRKKGNEYGATTGRPRRCGWLDMPLLRYSIRMGGITKLAVTKLDVLSGFRKIPVCDAYGVPEGSLIQDDRVHSGFVKPNTTLNGNVLSFVKPELTDLPGWNKDISGIRDWDDLPENAMAYLDRISGATDREVVFVGVGAERAATILG
jgi:adenylosuccinate synthase